VSPARARGRAEPERPPEFLRRLGLEPRRALGQHFLVDELLLARIADACELGPGETVIEVGAGPGGLTRELAARAGRVVAVEIDEQLAALARQQLADSPGVCVVAADVLDVAPFELLAECGAEPPYVMTGNLPYYITQPVIRRFLEADEPPRRLVVMVQREVARRIVGGDGKESVLSLATKTYGVPERLFDVPSSAFWPEPKVQSAVVAIERRPRPAVDLPQPELARFFVLLRAGFAEPRKQLHNGLRSALGLTREEMHAVIEAAGINPMLRPQHLDLDAWQRLYARLEASHPTALDVG
jgi:16S rRNA (adenine1518-N6/adenine1519-N6)-dimethyltransferase